MLLSHPRSSFNFYSRTAIMASIHKIIHWHVDSNYILFGIVVGRRAHIDVSVIQRWEPFLVRFEESGKMFWNERKVFRRKTSGEKTYSRNTSRWLSKTLSLASEMALLFKNSGSLTAKMRKKSKLFWDLRDGLLDYLKGEIIPMINLPISLAKWMAP